MKKLLMILAIILSISITGCVEWRWHGQRRKYKISNIT